MRSSESPSQKRFLDGDSSRRADDTSLSEAATEGLAQMAGALDKGLAPDNDAADRGPEAFAEAEGDGVEAGAVRLQGACACGDGFPEAGAIAVEFDAGGLGVRPSGDLLALCQREDGAC